MTTEKINKIAKTGLFLCWIGLSCTIGRYFLIQTYRMDPVYIVTRILDSIPLFFNIEGGQPLAPTDFAKNGIRIIRHK